MRGFIRTHNRQILKEVDLNKYEFKEFMDNLDAYYLLAVIEAEDGEAMKELKKMEQEIKQNRYTKVYLQYVVKNKVSDSDLDSLHTDYEYQGL